MIIVMSTGATEKQIKNVIDKVHSYGLRTHPIYGVRKTVIGIVGDNKTVVVENMSGMPGVESIIPVSYTHLRAHETRHDLVCRLLLEKKKKTKKEAIDSVS